MNPHLRTLCVALALAAAPVAAVHAQVNVGISVVVPGAQLGIHMPYYPHLVRVPGYPVYYAPQAAANVFFYDGLYWVYANDDWYTSVWYNGPWQLVQRDVVPLYVLRVPVRYYLRPPVYFTGWRIDAPPRWGVHWGRDWERNRPGWDRWDRHHMPRPAPLPVYQQHYAGDRYPGAIDQQRAIRAEHDRYRPREPVNRQLIGQAAPVPLPVARPEPHRDGMRGDDRGEFRGDGRGEARGEARGDTRGDVRPAMPAPRIVSTQPPVVQVQPALPAQPQVQAQQPNQPQHRMQRPPRPHEQPQQVVQPQRAQPERVRPQAQVQAQAQPQTHGPRGPGRDHRENSGPRGGREGRDGDRGQERRP